MNRFSIDFLQGLTEEPKSVEPIPIEMLLLVCPLVMCQFDYWMTFAYSSSVFTEPLVLRLRHVRRYNIFNLSTYLINNSMIRVVEIRRTQLN